MLPWKKTQNRKRTASGMTIEEQAPAMLLPGTVPQLFASTSVQSAAATENFTRGSPPSDKEFKDSKLESFHDSEDQCSDEGDGSGLWNTGLALGEVTSSNEQSNLLTMKGTGAPGNAPGEMWGGEDEKWGGIFSMPDPEQWTCQQVHQFFYHGRYAHHAGKFLDHEIRGVHLLKLDEESLARMGIKKMSEQLDIVESIALIISAWRNQHVGKPILPIAFLDGFLYCSFLGYDLNYGKRPNQQLEIFMNANSNICIVAALMLTTSMPFAMECAQNGGYAMEGPPLGMFQICTFSSGGFLMLCLILCIIFNLASGQLSNETEIKAFFEELGNFKIWPMRFMVLGCWFQFAMYTIFMVFNKQVGAASGSELATYGAVAITLPWLMCFHFMFIVAVAIRSLHSAKMQIVLQAIADGHPKTNRSVSVTRLHKIRQANAQFIGILKSMRVKKTPSSSSM